MPILRYSTSHQSVDSSASCLESTLNGFAYGVPLQSRSRWGESQTLRNIHRYLSYSCQSQFMAIPNDERSRAYRVGHAMPLSSNSFGSVCIYQRRCCSRTLHSDHDASK